MTVINGRLFVLTPARDEAVTLRTLAAALQRQTFPVALWLILENGSSDGTREVATQFCLRSGQDCPSAGAGTGIETGAVARCLCPPEEALGLAPNETTIYAVGVKYARIIAAGLGLLEAWLEAKGAPLEDGDFIALLDADTCPAPDYLALLVEAFAQDPALGLASGLTLDSVSGRPTPHDPHWPRGACRVWRVRALRDVCSGEGFPVGPSADVLSAIRAILAGWRIDVVCAARCAMRDVGARTGPAYYGAASYFRGETLVYVGLRSLWHIAHCRFGAGWGLMAGYCGQWFQRAPRTQDDAILRHCRRALWRKAGWWPRRVKR